MTAVPGYTPAAAASNTALIALGLASQPVPSLRRSALLLVGSAALLLAAAVVVALKGFAAGTELLPPAVGRPRAERERIGAELQVARSAQMKMLPGKPPEITGFDISACCHPVRDVGGDLCDFGQLHGGGVGLGVGNIAWGMSVGDVSGKGMAAALYMTLARGLLAGAAEDRDDPLEILRDVNRDFYKLTPKTVFITMLFAALEPSSRRLRFVRAGHTPLVWRRASRQETLFLSPPGLAVGMAPSSLFGKVLQAEEIRLEPGDALFLASDGLP